MKETSKMISCFTAGFGKNSVVFQDVIACLEKQLALVNADKSFEELFDKWVTREEEIHDALENALDHLLSEVYFMIIVFFFFSVGKAGSSRANGKISEREGLNHAAGMFYNALHEEGTMFHPYLSMLKYLISGNTREESIDFSRVFNAIIDNMDIHSLFEQLKRKVDIISGLYQDIFTKAEKYTTGSYYTPESLCELMVDHLSPSGDDLLLDPTCGTGAFLVTTIRICRNRRDMEKSIANQLHGFDINPIAIIGARVNVWLASGNRDLEIQRLFSSIKVLDVTDLESGNKLASKFDIILGNPPWVTLKDFATKAYKNKILGLSKRLGIYPSAHVVPQLEIATIIFSFAIQHLLKKGGKIFFVMTSSFLDGKHCGKFRRLDGIKNPMIWLFEGESIFPRKFACLYAEKGSDGKCFFLNKDRIPGQLWRISWNSKKKRHAFKPVTKENLTPINKLQIQQQRSKKECPEIKKLVFGKEGERVLDTSIPSKYKEEKCYNGATIFPQSLLFVRILEEHVNPAGSKEVARITPALYLRMRKPWNFYPYDVATVEKRYIFNVVKGSELYPFGSHHPLKTFLPLVRAGDGFKFDSKHFSATGRKHDGTRCLATDHWEHLNATYKKHANTSGRIKNLWDRINFDNGLENRAMYSQYKVILPDCGSVMAAAIVSRDTIVEHALHYIGVENEEEAYYLMGVLNAPCIERDMVEFTKAERHIGQLALDYNIPLFNKKNNLHRDIVEISRELESITRKCVLTLAGEKVRQYKKDFFCTASRSFIRKNKVKTHAVKCKKYKRLASLRGETDQDDLIIRVKGARRDKITVKHSRRKIKRELLEIPEFREKFEELDKMVLKLLKAKEGQGRIW